MKQTSQAIIDVAAQPSAAFAVGLDLTEGEQSPIAFVIWSHDGKQTFHRTDVSGARAIIKTLEDLVQRVTDEKVN